MKLNSSQLAQVQQAKIDGQARTRIELSDEQKHDWQTEVQQENAGRVENIAHLQKIRAAANQAGFFGDVRRSMLHARRPIEELAAAMGVEPNLLSDFRAGDADLPPAALDRLIEALGLRLMQEIPHDAAR